ncbi:PilX N-terminal domain-containing pilus assembly protein [uncultured Thiodictyon sp.]|uniref:pilus assembly PilX family protein n=1 Tax=uncultured Thiodictyon sp. TaxID=1846217 RepID=UPI0025FF91E4|nr:PilX N-terminal domain-containing pilus assembly protein [uncultured Thiodictyon sp.]
MTDSRGAVLVISLVLLLALSLIGVSAMQSATQEEHIAGNFNQRNIVFQAAEGALRAGERYVSSTTPPTTVAQVTTGTNDLVTYWQNVFGWSDTGTSVSLGGNVQASYVVELMAGTCPSSGTSGGDLGIKPKDPSQSATLYRVTARGIVAATDAVAILQSLYCH